MDVERIATAGDRQEAWSEAFAWADTNRSTEAAIRYANYYAQVIAPIEDMNEWPDFTTVKCG